MHHSDTATTSASSRPGTRRRVAIAILGLAGGLVAVTGAPSPADASAPVTTCVATSPTSDWKSAATAANTALTKALTNIQNQKYARATDHLRVMKNKARTANTAAISLIGKPSTDPESDDLPGVGAVLKVNGLDHRITLALIPLFSDPKGQHVVPALSRGLNRVDACRDVMLGTVIALRPGARDDYVDGLSDSLPSFPQELNAMKSALAGTGLTAGGRAALQLAQQVVTATNADMQRVFGGGERSPLLR